MIFQFHTGDVTFFDEDREYFEKRFFHLKKILGFDAGDSDSIKTDVRISKNRHKTGDRFEAIATVVSPHGGRFHAEISANNIKECADKLEGKLNQQARKFHEKHK